MQAQAQSLQKAARLSSADAASQLQQSVAEVLGSGAKLSLEGSRATLTLSGVSAENLAQFLTTARTKSHALPLEAHLQKFENANANTNSNGNAPAKTKSSGASQLWRGTLILNLPSN
jgi:general secretion pathway protein M